MGASFDFCRVLVASFLFFWALPLLSRRLVGTAPGAWTQDILPAFIRALLVFQVAGITLGCWHLAFAGALFCVTAVWLVAEVAFSASRRKTYRLSWWLAQGAQLACWMERHGWKGAAGRFRQTLSPVLQSPLAILLGAIALVALPTRIAFPLFHQRFVDSGAYLRAMSLNQLMQGGEWYPDGSVAFLLPLVHFSGVDAAAAIRWTSPLILVGILLALAYCAFVWTRSLPAACLAPLLLESYKRWLAAPSWKEAGPADIATLFWLIALSLLRTSKWYASGAALLALSVLFQAPDALAPALSALLLSALVAWLLRAIPYTLPARALVPLIAVCALVLYPGVAAPPEDGPLQYESSARTAARIAAERPRNKYLVVAPTQESIAIYGRGWHEELASFVRKFNPIVPIQADFRFPYTIPEMFVFVEKEPLFQPTVSPVASADANSYFYYTRVGRASLQFQAARIMSSYARTHNNASVYYEDDRIMVYHIKLSPGRQN
ncbi:MAG: hypothetical protein HY821_02065 [Acidobacteria bacterium]|nr:hypothetical protein [Acidobacteriota bacterium]